MKENSIKEDIKNAEHFIKSIKTDKEYKEENGWHGYYNKEIVELARMLENILSNYKRVLKENEELKISNKEIDKECSRLERKEVEMEKIIDLIIKDLYKQAHISTRCYLQISIEECMKNKNCIECLKQYFINNAKEVKK